MRSSRSWRIFRWTAILVACALLGLLLSVVLTTDVSMEHAGAEADPCRSISSSGSTPAGCEAFHNTCPAYTMEVSGQTFEPFQNELPQTEIEGIHFPRIGRAQYRGTRESVDQFTVPKVLRAIGGDP